VKPEAIIHRPPLVFWVCLWLVPLMPTALVVAAELAQLDGLMLPKVGQWLGRDFGALWLGGSLAREGGNVYDFAAWFQWNREAGIAAAQYYLYPPHSLLHAALLSQLPYLVALVLWTILSAVLLYLAAKPVVPFDARWTLAWSAQIFFSGQYGAIAAALWLWSFRPNQVRSGIAAGFLTVKPHLGILLALALLAKRRWLQIGMAVVLSAALLIAAELRFGLLNEYLTQASATQRALLTDTADQPYFLGIPSAYVALRDTPAALIGHLLASGAAIALLWRIRTASFPDLCFPLATATFIVLPYSFGYDMAAASLGFAVLLYRRWAVLSLPQKAIATLAFWVPSLTFTGLAPLILLVGLWLQVRFCGRGEGRPARVATDV
jgi:alpha-1,2-mannosyltransferase